MKMDALALADNHVYVARSQKIIRIWFDSYANDAMYLYK